jgi:hypothetical protein
MNQPNTTTIQQTDADGNETLVEVGPFGINATIQHPAAVAFSTAMYDWFRTSGGQNYVEVRCQVEDPEKGMQQFCITMQRIGGLTPTEKLAVAQSRIEELAQELKDDAETNAMLRNRVVELEIALAISENARLHAIQRMSDTIRELRSCQ